MNLWMYRPEVILEEEMAFIESMNLSLHYL